MKETGVVSVIIYLFRNYLVQGYRFDNKPLKLIQQLGEAGFDRFSIYRAFEWLGCFRNESQQLNFEQNSDTFRPYTALEIEKIDTEARGFLTLLEQNGILRPGTREMVLHQAMALDETTLDVRLIKWITLLVLLTQPEDKEALIAMEFLLFDGVNKKIH